MRIFLWLLVAVAVVLLIWLFAAWNIAESAAKRDATGQIQDITAALRAAVADGELTPDEMRAIGVSEVSRENGRLVVSGRTYAERTWWAPLANGTATRERSAEWAVNGTHVTIYPQG
ncbi:hypothetical protein [Lentzea sp. NPDC051838]|uniref:hypothetical protein n=1 Tax=Lentzea sp. NPDC051838 TaxID=3154849 RepID=UPI00341293EC